MSTEQPSIPSGLLAAFGLDGGTSQQVQVLGGGHIHRTLRITTASDDVVAQAVNRNVFTDLDACEDNLSRIDRHIGADAPIAVPRLRRTANDRVHWIDGDGVAWRISDYSTGTLPGTTARTPDAAAEAARAFGSYVYVLSSLHGPELRETLPRFHDFDRRRRDFEVAVAADRVGRRTTCDDVVRQALRLLADPDVTHSLAALPRQAVHNDAKVANLRFDESGRACMVVDLDTTMPGSVLYDLGELLRSATGDAAEDEEDVARIELDDDRILAVVQGFADGARDAFDAASRAHAGIAGARLALENAIRMLGDHLDGDRYYAIERDGHNLIRARAQLRVAALLLERRGMIEAAARTTHASPAMRSTLPVLHFAAPQGWINDPNGLVAHDGWWHLFYQHHPDSLVWGPMHWGHARSRDLTSWEHLPLALRPDRNGAAFSGSAVVDHDGTAGLGVGAIVAVYTLAGTSQDQGIASSIDGGITFLPHPSNPVLRAPDGVKDFRDPKVFEDARPGDERRWCMVLAVGTEVWIYRSADLIAWDRVGTYTDDPGSGWGTWETPDLFTLPDPSTGEQVWVLSIGMTTNAPVGSFGTYYRTGHFDGSTFTTNDGGGRWADHGPDFYAAQTWSGTGERRVWIGWLNNWRYATSSPHGASRGLMSVARELSLVRTDTGLVLAQSPVVPPPTRPGRTLGAGTHEVAGATAATIHGGAGATDLLSITIETGGDSATVELDGINRLLRVRRQGPIAASIEGFAFDTTAELPVLAGASSSTDVRIVIDAGSLEVFTADGTVVISALTSQVRAFDRLVITTTVPVVVGTLEGQTAT